MAALTPLERRLHNEGERLIPGVTHNLDEVRRHKSSYAFFRRLIECDIAGGAVAAPVRIVDFGSGVGHGCETLSRIPGSQVVGVDISQDCLDFARLHYGAPNINYEIADLSAYPAIMPEFDYVVSRGVLEHVPSGLEVARTSRWTRRLMFDVPYDEDAENPHHVVHRIREDAFADFPGRELLYQDLSGAMYDAARKPSKPNMIMCVCTGPGLGRVADSGIRFPVPAWHPDAETIRTYEAIEAACTGEGPSAALRGLTLPYRAIRRLARIVRRWTSPGV